MPIRIEDNSKILLLANTKQQVGQLVRQVYKQEDVYSVGCQDQGHKLFNGMTQLCE